MSYNNLKGFLSSLASYGKHAQMHLDHMSNVDRMSVYTELSNLCDGITGLNGASFTALKQLTLAFATGGNDSQGVLSHTSSSTRSQAKAEMLSLVGGFNTLEAQEGLVPGDYSAFAGRFGDLMDAVNDLGTWVERLTVGEMAAASEQLGALVDRANGDAVAIDVMALQPDLWLDADVNVDYEGTGTIDEVGTGTGTDIIDVRVNKWTSRDQNAVEFVQATPALMPGLMEWQDKQALYFYNGPYLRRAVATLKGSSGLFLMAFSNMLPASSAAYYMQAKSGSANVYMTFLNLNGMRFAYKESSAYTTDQFTTPIINSDPRIMEWKSDGSALSLRNNGAAVVITVSTGVNKGQWFGGGPGQNISMIGATDLNGTIASKFKGLIGSVLAFDRDMTAAQATIARNYLATKYGITLS